MENELVVFDAGAEASLGTPDSENFLAEHLLIGFGKPGGVFVARWRPNDLFLVHLSGGHAHPSGTSEN